MQITLLGFICRYGEITTQANSKNYRALSRERIKILKRWRTFYLIRKVELKAVECLIVLCCAQSESLKETIINIVLGRMQHGSIH